MKTLKSMRLQIGVFGRTNVGKSSLLNRITNQEISIVSEIAGTTTDVVEKSMELLPVGPVTFLDTAGLDDNTELGEKRIEKTMKIVNRIDVAVIVCDYNGLDDYEKELIAKLDELKIPYLIVENKCDIKKLEIEDFKNVLYTSVKDDEGLVFRFKEALVRLLPDDFVNSPKIAGDLVPPKGTVILVIPIDKEAPKGRIILPQVQTIRDLLDSDCMSYVVKETELKQAHLTVNIYSDILTGTMDAFASIISNNVNTIMKRMTSISIILMVPTLIASFYGMNVPIYGENMPHGFAIIVMISITL